MLGWKFVKRLKTLAPLIIIELRFPRLLFCFILFFFFAIFFCLIEAIILVHQLRAFKIEARVQTT